MSLPKRPDVVVVGAGIIGATTALSIARRGASVMVVEKEATSATEQSGRAQGAIRVQGREPVELPLAEESLRLWRDLPDPEALELRFTGNMYICISHQELQTADELVTQAHRHGLTRVRRISADEAREILPAATGIFSGAMWSEEDAQCDPTLATRYFVAAAERHGAEFQFGLTARSILHKDDAVAGVMVDDRTIKTRTVVVAAGVWAPYIAASVGLTLPIMPLALSQAETSPANVAVGPTLRAFGFGARQRPNGQLSISAGMNTIVDHYGSFASLNLPRTWLPRIARHYKDVRLHIDRARLWQEIRLRSASSGQLVTRSIERPANTSLMNRSLARLQDVIPALRDVEAVRYWAGTIDMSPDGLPIIDAEEGPEGLVVISGLCGHGLALGPALGEIAADLALDGKTRRPIAPFALSRFGGPTPIPKKML